MSLHDPLPQYHNDETIVIVSRLELRRFFERSGRYQDGTAPTDWQGSASVGINLYLQFVEVEIQ